MYDKIYHDRVNKVMDDVISISNGLKGRCVTETGALVTGASSKELDSRDSFAFMNKMQDMVCDLHVFNSRECGEFLDILEEHCKGMKEGLEAGKDTVAGYGFLVNLCKDYESMREAHGVYGGNMYIQDVTRHKEKLNKDCGIGGAVFSTEGYKDNDRRQFPVIETDNKFEDVSNDLGSVDIKAGIGVCTVKASDKEFDFSELITLKGLNVKLDMPSAVKYNDDMFISMDMKGIYLKDCVITTDFDPSKLNLIKNATFDNCVFRDSWLTDCIDKDSCNLYDCTFIHDKGDAFSDNMTNETDYNVYKVDKDAVKFVIEPEQMSFNFDELTEDAEDDDFEI